MIGLAWWGGLGRSNLPKQVDYGYGDRAAPARVAHDNARVGTWRNRGTGIVLAPATPMER
jgi:hypothetical protein